MTIHFKPQGVALAALLTLASVHSAQAARLQLVSSGTAVDVLTQSTSLEGSVTSRSVTGNLQDSSGAGTVLLSDFQAFGPATLGLLSVEDGYSHLVSVDASGTQTSITLDASHYWKGTGPVGVSAGVLSDYSLTQSLSLDGLSLQVVADAGESIGQAVTVSFSGLVQALLSSAAQNNNLGLTLDVLLGTTTLGSYQGLWTGNATETVNLSFSAVVGDTLSVLVSGYQDASAGSLLTPEGGFEYSGGVLLQGNFAVTAVPEPETWGLALVGLLIAGVAARQRA
jgi:PEP-CTERM motif